MGAVLSSEHFYLHDITDITHISVAQQMHIVNQIEQTVLMSKNLNVENFRLSK